MAGDRRFMLALSMSTILSFMHRGCTMPSPRHKACGGVWSVGFAVLLNASALMSMEQCLR